MGHEVSLTVVGVGANLADRYRIGDRFIVQAEIYYKGVNWAYGYMLQGGLSRYGVLDERVLNGDDGVYLIPVQASTGYAESALTEPWACVTAAYGLHYRDGLKAGGTAWIIGAEGQGSGIRDQEQGQLHDSSRLRCYIASGSPILTNVPAPFAGWLRERAAALGVEVLDAPDIAALPVNEVDDIVLPGADPTWSRPPARVWRRTASSPSSPTSRCLGRSAWIQAASTTTTGFTSAAKGRTSPRCTAKCRCAPS